jgi:hypothetical protein
VQPEDLSDEVYYSIEQFFDEEFSEIRSAVKDDIEENWGSLPDGPFNTDPFIEPRLKILSERPKYAVYDCEIEDGLLRLFVSFRCDATIRCKEYRDKGKDFPLRTRRVTGLVTYEIPVNLTIDLEANEIEDFEIGDLAWEMMKWPKKQVRVDFAHRDEPWDIDRILQSPSSLSPDLLDKVRIIFDVVSPILGKPLELFERQFLREACPEKAIALWCRIIATWRAYREQYLQQRCTRAQGKAIIEALISIAAGGADKSSLGIEEEVAVRLVRCFEGWAKE